MLIIDGVARSGTTFLSAVIHSLPSTFFLTENIRLPMLCKEAHGDYRYPKNLMNYYSAGNLEEIIPGFSFIEKSRCWSIISNYIEPSIFLMIQNIVKERLGEEPDVNYFKFFEIFHEALSLVVGKSIVGGKTTFCHNYKKQMLGSILSLKWIDVIRDPRAVYASGIPLGLYKLRKLAYFDPWLEQVISIRDLPEFLKDRHMTIRYEDLIEKKKSTVETLCQFLEIDNFDYAEWIKKDMKKSDGTLFGTHSSFNENDEAVGSIAFREGIDFDEKPLKRWENILSVSQKWLLSKIYERELHQYSYSANTNFRPELKEICNYYVIVFGRLLRRLFLQNKREI